MGQKCMGKLTSGAQGTSNAKEQSGRGGGHFGEKVYQWKVEEWVGGKKREYKKCRYMGLNPVFLKIGYLKVQCATSKGKSLSSGGLLYHAGQTYISGQPKILQTCRSVTGPFPHDSILHIFSSAI